MGEMADAALNEVMDMEDLRHDYRMGQVSTEEAYDAGIIDEHGAEPFPVREDDCEEDEEDDKPRAPAATEKEG
jgi:hypothetical protein